MKVTSIDKAAGLAFDEETQSFVPLESVQLADLATSADPGAAADGEEDSDDSDGGMTVDDEDEEVGESYDVRSLLSINAKLRTQLAGALQKIAQMQAQREQELRDGERLSELAEAGFVQLTEIRQTFAEQNERDMMRLLDALAQRRHGMGYSDLVAKDYPAACRVLADVERGTTRY